MSTGTLESSSTSGLQPPTSGLLRFLTCGSVDDGKSTLIGRLLYDSKAILADALNALERTSLRRGHRGMDLSLLTDGLQAEREQGITIDVAYRYFSTGARKYILADAPGHEQYTRNMVTAASTADLAIVLVDARKGLLTQTRRHSAITHLLGIRHLVVAVNKMDLVDWSEARFEAIRAEYLAFADGFGLVDVRFIPLSALQGDMVVDRGEHLPWYEGPTLMQALEAAELDHAAAGLPFRFPVQLVSRPHQDHRAYLGRVESGTVHVGDTLTALPSGRSSRVKAIHLGTSPLEAAVAGQSVALRLQDELDISRGDLLAAAEDAPPATRELAATLCWFSEAPLAPGRRYLLRHGTHELRAVVDRIDHRLDIHALEARTASSLELNDLGRVRLRLQQPLAADAYARNRSTGAFILVDEATHATVAAGLIQS
ncbi:MAG TPA: sulfate adenylyltransferase subunit 1 [Holophagaceae bacterium]|nr:sulfate adenylyltransferase subunit 1 [Holophagaceae bacterium]